MIFEHCGPDRDLERSRDKFQIPAPPSNSAVQSIFRRALDMGGIFWGSSFKRKTRLRKGQPGFNSLDLVNVIRRCNIISGPIYNGDFHGWQYELADRVEGFKFVLVVLLEGSADYLTAPQITVLGGGFRRGKINRRRRQIGEHKPPEEGG